MDKPTPDQETFTRLGKKLEIARIIVEEWTSLAVSTPAPRTNYKRP
jgi:hypothetical protein